MALRETHKMRDLGWFDSDIFEEYLGQYEVESWSQFIIDHLKEQHHAADV